MATGKPTFSVRTASCTFGRSFSNENSGVCTPITTSPASLYFSAHALMYGSGRSELMQVYVQKSTSTTFPRSDLPVSGSELSQPSAPPSSGMRPSSARAGCSALPSAPSAATVTPIAGSRDSPMITFLITPPSQDLVDPVHRAVRARLADADGDDAIQECVRLRRSLEPRYRPEVVARGIDDLSAPEGGDRVRGAVTQPLERHVDQRMVVRLQRDAQVQLQDAVRAEEEPVPSSGQDLAAQARSFEVAARDGHDDARAVG